MLVIYDVDVLSDVDLVLVNIDDEVGDGKLFDVDVRMTVFDVDDIL